MIGFAWPNLAEAIPNRIAINRTVRICPCECVHHRPGMMFKRNSRCAWPWLNSCMLYGLVSRRGRHWRSPPAGSPSHHDKSNDQPQLRHRFEVHERLHADASQCRKSLTWRSRTPRVRKMIGAIIMRMSFTNPSPTASSALPAPDRTGQRGLREDSGQNLKVKRICKTSVFRTGQARGHSPGGENCAR